MTPIRLAAATFCVAALLAGHGAGAGFIPGWGWRAAPAIGNENSILMDEPRFDLHGNPVEPAVGDYRIDPRGDVYEHHAPDTAVDELPPPAA